MQSKQVQVRAVFTCVIRLQVSPTYTCAGVEEDAKHLQVAKAHNMLVSVKRLLLGIHCMPLESRSVTLYVCL